MPQTMGAFILLIIILALAAGSVRQELVLTLIGAVFFIVWVYCLVMTLLLAALHSRRAKRFSIRISPGELSVGDTAHVFYSDSEQAAQKRVLQLPGILVRCRLLLHTKDGRRINYDFAPTPQTAASAGIAAATAGGESFEVKKRGAYFSDYDEYAIFDILGFFRFTFRIVQENAEAGLRLLASPNAALTPLTVNAKSGDSNRQPETTFLRNDILIEHRPYVPGDDPRRINWKLFSHGGDLFIREGEREPPPHSNITILVDGQFDPGLYTASEARRGVDALCENALAAALSSVAGGLNVQIGTNQTGAAAALQRTVTAAQIAGALAWPVAQPLGDYGFLKASQEGRESEAGGVLILALPRNSAGSSALDHFLTSRLPGSAGQGWTKSVQLIFLYHDDATEKRQGAEAKTAQAAQACAAMYSRRVGVRALAVAYSQ